MRLERGKIQLEEAKTSSMLARSLGSDKEFQPNIDGACLMRLSGIDEVSKVVSVIEVEGGKERKRGTGKRH